VLGDPVCAEEDFAQLLMDFRDYCAKREYQCIFMGTTNQHLKVYETLGYHYVKCGEEARFALADYQISGKKMAKMRMNINHAKNAGFETYEYKPNERRNPEIEKAFKAVSEDWMKSKKSGMLSFSIGSVGLEDPMDRRYFYAKDASGKIQAFNVFCPFLGMGGWMADITRRTNDCPGGATEKIMYDAFMVFKEEGYPWASMGLSPLSNVREGEEDSLTAKFLEFVGEKGNRFYGFQDLHRAKEKYAPSDWEPGYFVYSGSMLTPQMAYAAVRIQNTGGIGDFMGSFLRGFWHDFAQAKRKELRQKKEQNVPSA
jgi:phosphatidylglycerol lysyltransferase